MLRINTHIERLLQIYDCVIIPELGGFVLQAVPAAILPEENLFRPMHKDIVFNINLRHNDGLLTESYMKIYSVDFRTARLMVGEDVKELLSSLEKDRKAVIGAVGTLTMGEEGTLSFQSAEPHIFSLDSYGLPPFRFKPLASLLQEEEPQVLPVVLPREEKPEKDTLYIPISKRVFRAVGISAAALALFLLVSTPVKDIDRSAYTASFIPSALITEASYPAVDISSAEQPVADVAKEEAMPEPVIEQPKEVEQPVVSQPAPVQSQPKAKVQNKKMYHVVIGSLVSQQQADEFISKLDKKQYPNVNKIARDGKVRVYADKFENRAEAEAYLAKLRNGWYFPDAWLFISR